MPLTSTQIYGYSNPDAMTKDFIDTYAISFAAIMEMFVEGTNKVLKVPQHTSAHSVDFGEFSVVMRADVTTMGNTVGWLYTVSVSHVSSRGERVYLCRDTYEDEIRAWIYNMRVFHRGRASDEPQEPVPWPRADRPTPENYGSW